MTVTIEAAELVVRFGGWDALWAFRRVLRIPLDHVADAQVVERRGLRAGLRLGGTAWPDRIRAGRFWSPRLDWSFWSTRRADEVLLVTLHDDHYRRVVLEVDDPHAVAASLSGV
jgi:hypothetical protein